MALKLMIVLFLLFILYQDLKYRAVYWVCFPALFILFIALSLGIKLPRIFLSDGLTNAFFLAVQLGLLVAYFSLKERKWITITTDRLGWGDILFIFVTGAYFSPLNYILFYTGSLLLVSVLTAGGCFRSGRGIPLAGIQAALLSVLILADKNNSLASDNWVIGYVFL